MIISIAKHVDDDPAFLTALSSFMAQIVTDRQPELVYALRVTKWFDHKWLRYSGKGRVAFNIQSGLAIDRDTALDAIHSAQLTFPAFSPRAIASQRTWRRAESGAYRRIYGMRHPHSRQLQHSAHNLHRRVAAFADSVLFIWFSSGSLSTGAAAVLVYQALLGGTDAWYCSFRRGETWQVHRTKGISRSVIESCFPLRAAK